MLLLRPSTSFSRNILTLFTGSAIVCILPVVLYPVLKRIFTVRDNALFGLCISIFSFFEIASAVRYDYGVVLPEQDGNAISLGWGGLVISVGCGLFILILVVLLRDLIATKFRSPPKADWTY